MQDVARHQVGVFEPDEIREMQEEFDRGGTPEETCAERTERACDIARRKDVESPTNSALSLLP